MRFKDSHTMAACYLSLITQAAVNNLAPLLLLTFRAQWGLTLEQLTLLTTLNFSVQLVVDLLSAKAVDKIGYRPCMVVAHVLAAAGLAVRSCEAFYGLDSSWCRLAVGTRADNERLVEKLRQICPQQPEEEAAQ